jgi:hypothetical protein
MDPFSSKVEGAMAELLESLFDSSGFMPRWL